MRKLLLLLSLILLPSLAFARQSAQGDCVLGGKVVVTSGLNSTTKVMTSYPSCTVTVSIHGGGLATIYSDNNGTVLANPFVATTAGHFQAYADNGHYDVLISGGTPQVMPTSFTYSDIILNDPAQQSTGVCGLSYVASLTINAAACSDFTVTMTGNVTSSTVTNAIIGQQITISACQDVIGGHTFAWPTSFTRPPTIDLTASACTNVMFFFDGINWRQMAASGDTLTPTTGGITGTWAGNPTWTGNHLYTGNINYTGTITTRNINFEQMVTVGNPQGWGGTDLGGWVNSMIGVLGTQGGVVHIGNGVYSFSTTIVKPRYVQMECDSANGTQLQYTGTSAAIVIADTGSPTAYPVNGIDKCFIAGPSPGGSTIGVYIGGDPANVLSASGSFGDHQRITQTRISGFGTGIKFGNNAFLDVLSLSGLFGSGINYNIPTGLTNSGENMSIIGSTIANATVTGFRNDLSTAEVYLTDTSIDANAAPEAVCTTGQIHSFQSHWEAQSGEFIAASGTCKLDIQGGQFLWDSAVGTDTDFISVAGNSSPSLIMEGPIFSSAHAVTQIVNWTATGGAKVLKIGALPNYNGAGTIPTLINAAAVATPFNGLWINDGQGNTYYGNLGNFMNGLKVTTIGNGTSVNTLQIYDSVGNQSKFIRVSSNALQISNNAFSATLLSLSDIGDGTFMGNLNVNGGGGLTVAQQTRSKQVISDQGSFCTTGELALSAGWGTTASKVLYAGTGQTCEWTITSSGTGQGANPTITDTLVNGLPTGNTLCEMRMVGGTGTVTLLDNTTLSATAPVFTFAGTPVAASTYTILRRCGP